MLQIPARETRIKASPLPRFGIGISAALIHQSNSWARMQDPPQERLFGVLANEMSVRRLAYD